jgi:iron(II)-dependent oxidoreductase
VTLSRSHAVDLDRGLLLDWYQKNRARSRALFDMLVGEDTYYSQPIALRHPIVFYDGHLPAFSFNTLVKKGLGGRSIDRDLETLFARGIDPATTAGATAPDDNRRRWPSRERVRAFADEADRRVTDALTDADLDRPGHPLLDRAEAVFTILEHEAMHQETLLYMWHRLPFAQKRRPGGYRPRPGSAPPEQGWVHVPAGRAVLGVDRDHVTFGWDNEFPATVADVPAFSIQRHDVTNEAFRQFVDATGVEPPLFWEQHDGSWYWRGMFDLIPLPAAWPVFVTHQQACAYARWRGCRLPVEAEYQRAALGAPAEGVLDFASWDPQPAGSHPAAASAWGIHDLVGNGWEWTSTVFAPFNGFKPMASYPQYSADFFDGEHYVMKGASPVTARELVRPTLRNWFRPNYPYVYATFRCVEREA